MIQEHLVQLRQVRERTLDLIAPLSQRQMDYIPEPGEWSVGEVVDHLVLCEQHLRQDIAILIERAQAGQRPYLYRSFAEVNARPAFLPAVMLPLLEAPLNFVNQFAPAAIREYVVRHVPFRALAPDVFMPQHGKSKGVLDEALRSALRETEALFAANPREDFDRMQHQHPLFGVQTVPQLLRTLGLHEQAHQDQISRVLASPSFPSMAAKFG